MRRQAGFTLLELMVTVAIIAILAGVAVPSFFSTSRRAKAMSEVGTVFSDLRTRMDQYLLENGQYPVTGTEATTWPAVPGAQKQNARPMPANWTNLKVRLSGDTQVYCGYSWITGLHDATNRADRRGGAVSFTRWRRTGTTCSRDMTAIRRSTATTRQRRYKDQDEVSGP